MRDQVCGDHHYTRATPNAHSLLVFLLLFVSITLFLSRLVSRQLHTPILNASHTPASPTHTLCQPNSHNYTVRTRTQSKRRQRAPSVRFYMYGCVCWWVCKCQKTVALSKYFPFFAYDPRTTWPPGGTQNASHDSIVKYHFKNYMDKRLY